MRFLVRQTSSVQTSEAITCPLCMGYPVGPVLSLTLLTPLSLHHLESLCSVIGAASGVVSAISTPGKSMASKPAGV